MNLSLLEDVSDDIDFCFKLAREESVILLPGEDTISVYNNKFYIFFSCNELYILRVHVFYIFFVCGWMRLSRDCGGAEELAEDNVCGRCNFNRRSF